jgi:hypothetical protein
MSSKTKRRLALEGALNAAMRDVSGRGVLYRRLGRLAAPRSQMLRHEDCFQNGIDKLRSGALITGGFWDHISSILAHNTKRSHYD